MDLQRLEKINPRLQISEKIDLFTQFIERRDEEIDVAVAVVNEKTILSDLLLKLFLSIIPGVYRINLDDFKLFILSVRELLWYVTPHHVKFKDGSCMLPSQLI